MANEKKNRRMELRREIGSRKVKEMPLPSPRTAYLAAHACFNCRKSFKLSCEKSHVCPECGETAYLMGRAFKTPKRSDDEQWRKVQKLYTLGFRFHRYGGDYPPLPERFREVDRFVKEFANHELRVAEPDLSLLPGDR